MPRAPKPKAPRTRAQRLRRRIAVGVAVAAGLVLVAFVVLTVHVADRALTAKGALERAQSQLTRFQAAIGQRDAPSTAALYAALRRNTATAAEQVDDPVWALYERLPLAGPNLTAFRQTAVLVDDLVHDGVGPLARAADGISVESLKPHDGGIDIQPLKRLTPAIGDIDDAIQAAEHRATEIDTAGVVPQLRTPVQKLQATLAKAAPVTHELRKVMPVLYPALGGEGTRHYLLMFQNNAEERASGGNPASMAMLVVRNGKVSLGRQGDSGNFPHPYPAPPYTPSGKGDGDWEKLYSDYASTYVTNITMTPDFPTNAKLARTMWRGVYGGKVDGVISFDPVALSSLMTVTGPVRLVDGYRIDSSNAVRYLLSDVYAKYADPDKQDAVFASAARGIFAAVTNGAGDPAAYVKALDPMIEQQRLKLWSVRADEQALIADSPVGNMLPADNADATVLGVYNNDDATSKMSYYMDQRIAVVADRCTATPRYTVTATVANTLPVARAHSLPEYVRAHQRRIVAGGDRQWVQVYGPVGAKLVSVTIDGRKVVWGTSLLPGDNTNPAATGVDDHRPAVRGSMYGRPVGIVSLNIGPASSMTVKAVFTGGTDPSRTVEVSHTPKVRATPVTITGAGCG